MATAMFFSEGTCSQYEQVLKLYPQALKLKADRRPKKPEELIKLDDWYQNELPKKIKSRGKDAHMIHEELVQTMKWKQVRGKYYPQLNYLVKVNTPRAVMAETKKAFKKLPNLEQAITALSNLKGVGTTMASALLAAADPASAPFMADECLMAIPDIEGIDYTTKEYLKFANHICLVAERLNKESQLNKKPEAVVWSAHKVELALWTHYILSDLKPSLLSHICPLANGNSISSVVLNSNGDSLDTAGTSDESNQGAPTGRGLNGNSNKTSSGVDVAALDEDTTTSFTTDNSPPPSALLLQNDETNDSLVSADSTTKDSVGEDSNSLGGVPTFTNTTTLKRPLESDENSDAAAKKLKDNVGDK
ncbi:unnamed protein product [Brassicogethes aeneus]|uniref:Uncharacterized protein n=1 Tax=Brassicogethes aeneus TaxID=1431903 RepID=A0A9P0BFR9_BRAAE|nr:unnamed protein product [Brassicogethes aeneus]